MSLPIVTVAQSLIAQKNKSSRISDQQTIKLLCNQWQIDNSNLQKGYFPVDSIATINFYTNGYAKFQTNKTLEGVWNYDFTRHNLFIILKGKISKYKILSISSTALVLENIGGKKTTKVNLFRTAQ